MMYAFIQQLLDADRADMAYALERDFINALAVHCDCDPAQVEGAFYDLEPEQMDQAQTPGGWTALAQLLCTPSTAPLIPTVH